MTRGRLALSVLLVLPLLASCGGQSASGLPSRAPDPSLVRQAKLPACPSTSGRPVAGGLPAVELPCFVGGDPMKLAGLRGPAMVNVWASDCGPCLEEAPTLAWLAGHARGRVQLLGVDDEADPNAGLRSAMHFGQRYPMVYDEHGEFLAALPGPNGTPITLFVRDDGRLAKPYFGRLPTGAALVSLVRDRLGVDLS